MLFTGNQNLGFCNDDSIHMTVNFLFFLYFFVRTKAC